MRGKPIIICQGGQWGSEAKGAVTDYLVKTRGVDYAVRTGATNAGHSFYYEGKKVVLQQLPCGISNPNAKLVIGAGALIDPEILDREVKMLSALTGTDICDRLFIDSRAGLHLSWHHTRSHEANRHHKIGATGKGCSEALVDRIKNRGNGYHLFGGSGYSGGYNLCDTEKLLNYGWNEGAQILLEGTQGQLLDLYLGPYPYVTHKQTGPGQWMLECGLSPALPTEIVLVLRTFPIRVAGNSGPMPRETDWPGLARFINSTRVHRGKPALVAEESIRAFEEAVAGAAPKFMMPSFLGTDIHTWSEKEREIHAVACSELHATAWAELTEGHQMELKKLFEMTTVTKKLRRVAHFDVESVGASARQARPSSVVLTFMNYLYPEYWYETPSREAMETAGMNHFCKMVEETTNAPVTLLGFGPERHHFIGR